MNIINILGFRGRTNNSTDVTPLLDISMLSCLEPYVEACTRVEALVGHVGHPLRVIELSVVLTVS